MKKYLLLSVILFFAFNGFAQIEGNTKAKLYFQEAQKLFNQNDYKDALNYIAKTETTLGSTNGRILNLKIKTLYNMGKFIEAEKALSLFSKSFENDVTEEMKNDTYAYFVRIEKAASAQKNKITKQEARKQELLSKADFNVRRTPDGTGLIKENGSIGLIDKSGNIIVPIKYKKIRDNDRGLVIADKNNNWEDGYVGSDLYKGNKLILSGYWFFRILKGYNNLITVHTKGKEGLYDANEERWIITIGEFSHSIEIVNGGVKGYNKGDYESEGKFYDLSKYK